MKNGVLRDFAKFTGKQLCQSLFFRSATLLKKILWHRCLPVNFAKFSRTLDDCFWSWLIFTSLIKIPNKTQAIQLKSWSANFTKRSNTLKKFVGKLPTNCLSVFDHFVGLALKGFNGWNEINMSFNIT